MTTRLYSVTVTDLGVYEVKVAADYPEEAERIAKSVLFEEMTILPPESRIVSREAEAKAEPCADLPFRTFKVHGRYELGFSLVVPAGSRAEAERHARRIYDDNCGPFEFDHDGGGVTRLVAEEVVS